MPKKSWPIYVVSYHIKWARTSWTDSKYLPRDPEQTSPRGGAPRRPSLWSPGPRHRWPGGETSESAPGLPSRPAPPVRGSHPVNNQKKTKRIRATEIFEIILNEYFRYS